MMLIIKIIMLIYFALLYCISEWWFVFVFLIILCGESKDVSFHVNLGKVLLWIIDC